MDLDLPNFLENLLNFKATNFFMAIFLNFSFSYRFSVFPFFREKFVDFIGLAVFFREKFQISPLKSFSKII